MKSRSSPRRARGSVAPWLLALLLACFALSAWAVETPPNDSDRVADAGSGTDPAGVEIALSPDSTAAPKGPEAPASAPAGEGNLAPANPSAPAPAPSSEASKADAVTPSPASSTPSAAPATTPANTSAGTATSANPAPPEAPSPSAPKPTAASPSKTKSRAASKKSAPAAKSASPSDAAAPASEASSHGTPAVLAAAGPKQPLGEGRADERTRVMQGIAWTESVLRTVRAKVMRSFNKKAREDFEQAVSLQRDSREALGQNFFARADRLTQESRTLARQIAVHLGPPQDDPDYVGMTLDRTDDAIGRAKEVLRDAGGRDEHRRLDDLERRQKEARRFHKEGATRRSYAATRAVRDGVLTLLRDCDDLPVPAQTAERALKRADRAIEQAKAELGERPTPAAERLARNARDQMAKARSAFARKNYRDTLLYSKLVERDLELAVNAQRGATSRSG